MSALKFLGLILDENVTWNAHVNNVCNVLAKNIGVMYKLKSMPKVFLKMIYNSIVLPHLSYGIIIWGNASKTQLNRVCVLQKRAIRIVHHASYLAHSKPIFHLYKMLQFYDIYLLQLGIFMYLCYKKFLPESLLDYFFAEQHYP